MKKRCFVLATLLVTLSLAAGCAPREELEAQRVADESKTSVSEEVSVEAVQEIDENEEYLVKMLGEKNLERQRIYDYREVIDEPSENVVLPEGIKKIAFNGDANTFYQSNDYGVYESEKYILLVDKNVRLPGNYASMLNDIVDEIENVSGLSFLSDCKSFKNNMEPTHNGEYPFESLEPGNKFIIQINYEEGDNIYSGAKKHTGYCVLSTSGVDIMNGAVVPADYLFLFYNMGEVIVYDKIESARISNSIKDVLANLVIDGLEEKYPDLKRIVNDRKNMTYSMELTEENVVNAWYTECDDWSNYNEKNSFLEMFEYYMFDTYGSQYLPELAKNNGESCSRKKVAMTYLESFGTDVFRNFMIWLNGDDTKATEIKLSGEAGKSFVSEQKYYTEGENCFLYIDKGLTVPEDYLAFADSMIVLLQKKMLLTDEKITYTDSSFKSNDFYGISNNGKLPIYVMNDTAGQGLISYAADSSVKIYDYGMMRNNMDEIEYLTLAHESSHAVAERWSDYGKLGKTLVEGSADYYAETVLDEMGVDYDSYHSWYYDKPINASTAEELFRNDFSDVSHADRGAEYEYGYWLSKFLAQKYGDNFLVDFYNAIHESEMGDYSFYGDDNDREIRTQVMKDVFGESVFNDFGKWYVKNSK